MIGNDVIDLAQSRLESQWQRKGFVGKLFTDAEQKLIADHNNPEMLLWLLWSMKEAAYKIYNRQTKIREYIPKKLICSINCLDTSNSEGEVICNNNRYYIKSVIRNENIFTVAVSIPEDLDNIIEIERKDILKDESGIPYLITNIYPYKRDVSISHHGRFEQIVTLKANKQN